MLGGSEFSYTLPRADQFFPGIVATQDITKQFSKASKSSSHPISVISTLYLQNQNQNIHVLPGI